MRNANDIKFEKIKIGYWINEMYFSLKIFFWMIFLLLLAVSCSPSSLEDFREEGEGVMRSLIQELQAIHNREELLKASGRLQRLFDRLVTIMIAAEQYSFFHPELEKTSFHRQDRPLSDQLRVELNRLYRIEGGRQIIEKCQENALHRLDAFLKKSNG